jgi:hypothetical protein
MLDVGTSMGKNDSIQSKTLNISSIKSRDSFVGESLTGLTYFLKTGYRKIRKDLRIKQSFLNKKVIAREEHNQTEGR